MNLESTLHIANTYNARVLTGFSPITYPDREKILPKFGSLIRGAHPFYQEFPANNGLSTNGR